ncbi:MAG: transposase [Thermoleophilaceae bacterium]
MIDLVMDGAYATKAWRELPDRVTVTTRMRSNAAVFALAPPKTGKRGRPPLKGARLASLAQLAATARFVPVTITAPSGKTRVEHVWKTTCLWYGPFHTRPVTIMLIRKPDRSDGYDVAIASTDTAATTAELICRYDSRWTIETAHQEAKAHGVGQARNRVQRAVERTVPFGFLAMTITIAWYALHGDPDADLKTRRRTAPWYRQKATISYTDMLAALRRELIRHEYWAQAPAPTNPPQIATTPSPPALVAA